MTPASQALRVLIVDDERNVADTLALIVRASGYVVAVAYDGNEAITVAAVLKPNATISDVMMPGLDGFALAEWMQENCPDCRVLLLSGHSCVITQAETRMHNGHPCSVRTKPTHPSEILDFLANCELAA